MVLKIGILYAFLGCAFLFGGSAHSATKAKSKKPVAVEGQAASVSEPKPPIPTRESIEFRGIPLGSSENIVKEKFPEFNCYSTGSSPLSDRSCRVGENDATRLCANTGDGYMKCLGDETKAWTYGGAFSDVDVYFINDALIRVLISFHINLYPSILAALNEKYGKPDGSKTEELQNKMGAKFDNEISTWNVNGVTLTINKYGSNLTQSNVTYRLDSSVQDVAARIKMKNAGAAKSL